VLTPMNIQDVTGLHQMMPRSFSQLHELQHFHNEDPEDLLKKKLEVLPGLEKHAEANAATLAKLKEHNISHAYTRWSIAERFENIITDNDAKNWNDLMAKAQSIRFHASDDASNINGVFMDDPMLEDMGDDSVDLSAE
jgi:L-rhamnose mutarotase